MMEGWKKTDIGIVPSEWDVDRIGKFFWIQQGKQVSKKNRLGDNQKPFLRTSNLLWGKVILDKLDYLHFSSDEENKFKLQYNDLLVCEGGDIGRTAIWKNEMEGIYYQNHLHRVRAKNNDIDPEFVLNWMQYAFKYGKVYLGRANITTIPNLSKSRLAELSIPKPPLPEQRKIAYILSTVQKAIEQQDKLIKTTTELKKALMQKLFTEGLYGEKQKETEIGPVPESWEVVGFDNLLEVIKSQSHSRNKLTFEITKTRVMNIHYGDIHSTIENEVLNLDNTKLPYVKDKYNDEGKNQYLKDGDIVLADASEDLIDIAKSIEVINIKNKKVIGGLHTIVVRPKSNNIVLGYGAFIFRHKYVIDEIRLMATGLSVYGISKGNLKKLLIPLPPLAEQNFISNSIQKINSKIKTHQKKKQTLQDLFKTLLHELMTGQRRVNEIDFENKKGGLLLAAEPEIKYKTDGK